MTNETNKIKETSKEMKSQFMQEAINLSIEKMQEWVGWPFGCVIVKNWEIVGRWWNKVTSHNDPTAHAEVIAIRDACTNLGNFQLDWCELYTSCEPCPMCMGAIYRARPDKVYYWNTAEDAANIGFDDAFIYDELKLSNEHRKFVMQQLEHDNALEAFKLWENKQDKVEY